MVETPKAQARLEKLFLPFPVRPVTVRFRAFRLFWPEKARAEEAKQRERISALSDPDLQISLQQAKSTEREQESQGKAPARSRGMQLGR
jgi:hypothetical protein